MWTRAWCSSPPQQQPSGCPSYCNALARSGADIQETTLARPNLESLFLRLTGKALRE